MISRIHCMYALHNRNGCQNDHLKTELLATGDSLLGEANPTDNYFGIGLSLNNPRALIKSQWRGENLQGATLMSIREKLK